MKSALANSVDVVIVGGGHNGLVAATLLGRSGLKTLVVEEKSEIGGAAKTEKPFSKAPNLGTSTGAYLLGLMPPELMQKLGLKVEVVRRDPHYFLPTLDKRYLLFGSDVLAMKSQFESFFSEKDWQANQALNQEISQIREDLAPSWLQEPLSIEETAQKYIRPGLREVFSNLVVQPVENYLNRFGFQSELLVAMYAVTDGFSGLSSGFGMAGTGMNFLVHNMCRIPGADGTFMIAKGGMGAITKDLARLASEAGVEICTRAGVEKIRVEGGVARGVILKDGREVAASVVLSNADPFQMAKLLESDALPQGFQDKLANWKRMGTTLKVNLALDRLPVFKCLPENRGQHNATIHLLPSGPNVISQIQNGFNKVEMGQLAEFPTIEWYIHTQADPSLKDPEGRHNSAFFVQWVPYELQGTTWEREESRYVDHLISIAEEFAPGFRESVVDTFALTPPKIEKHFGISYGHIHHIDNTFGFDQRMPYRSPVEGLYSCSAGCHPAGSVIGASGHNAAMKILKDLGKS